MVIVPPEEGRLAGGDIGKGRLAEPATVVQAVVGLFTPGPLTGRTVVVTAGGTREAIDPVRYIGNRSSGRQGHALAAEAAAQGADVVLVTTSSLPTPAGVTRIDVESAAEMHDAVLARSSAADIVIMAAAVADFRPADIADQKLKKADGAPAVSLEPTIDILAALGADKPARQVLVGFAAETENLMENARGKLERKGADLLVANDVSAPGVGFAHSTNAVTIFGSDGSVRDVPLSDKSAVARIVLDEARSRLPDHSEGS